MNDFDKIAINSFDTSKGIYLVMSGSGEYQHLEARKLKALSIPLIGRILKKIGYPSYRFRKVVDYLATQQISMEGIKEEQRIALQTKIEHFFHLNSEDKATRHLDLWAKLQGQYPKNDSQGVVQSQNKNLHQLKVSSFFREGDRARAPSYERFMKIPEYVLKELPPEETYLVTATFEATRPWNNSGLGDGKNGLLKDLKEHLETLEAAPVILLYLFKGSGLYSLNEDHEAFFAGLKSEGLIRGYATIDTNLNPHLFPTWVDIKKENLKSIEKLKQQLS